MRNITIFLLVFFISGILAAAGRPRVIARIDAAAEQLMLLEGFFRGQTRLLCREAYAAATGAFKKRLSTDGLSLNPAEQRYWNKRVKPAFSLNGGQEKKPPFNTAK